VTPVFLSSAAGLIFSFAVMALLRPALPAPWRWAWQGVILQIGLWLILHGLLLAILGRPWFAMAIGLAFLMLLVQVSNAKFHSLREAFVFQDFEYFTDAIRHPRLYIPFLGWWKFLMIAIAVIVALSVGLLLEQPSDQRLALNGQLGEVLALLVIGCSLVWLASGGVKAVFDPEQDMQKFGFLASLWHYAQAERKPLNLPNQLPDLSSSGVELPDLLVVQSESFFDPRKLFPGIRQDILAQFDRINAEALAHGHLSVPAWGANTVRSEFAFLSGVAEGMLGVHRFNPYRQILKSQVVSLAKVLKSIGYRTICVHPYPASFYGRDKVYPHLGFDEFIDVQSFEGAERSGPYVSDLAVTEKIKSLMALAADPVFVFVITMENHGPLHLEKPNAGDLAASYSQPPPSGCEDLSVYLRHLCNADRMIGDLREFLSQRSRSARFCWYGDHVPIMADVYRHFGEPSGNTAYFVWSNQPGKKAFACNLAADKLASCLLATVVAP
jgi:hypothetical protein